MILDSSIQISWKRASYVTTWGEKCFCGKESFILEFSTLFRGGNLIWRSERKMIKAFAYSNEVWMWLWLNIFPNFWIKLSRFLFFILFYNGWLFVSKCHLIKPPKTGFPESIGGANEIRLFLENLWITPVYKYVFI